MRLRVSWPETVRAVRAWLAAWMLLTRWGQAWFDLPAPSALQRLLDHLGAGHPRDSSVR
ncbi:MAG: hypothetical protein M3Y58_15410 [Chloroflexota bacterium]|nr:hypothetical protein [Chloroflexota bacterium]